MEAVHEVAPDRCCPDFPLTQLGIVTRLALTARTRLVIVLRMVTTQVLVITCRHPGGNRPIHRGAKFDVIAVPPLDVRESVPRGGSGV